MAYLRVFDSNVNVYVSFVIGKAKLAPRHAITIPRLELNSAVLGVELVETAAEELNLKLDAVLFHSDSRVVLGYINNRTKQFYVYVANRVQRILPSSTSDQWPYVSTHLNPVDHATRGTRANEPMSTSWLKGPDILRLQSPSSAGKRHQKDGAFEVSDRNPEVRLQVNVCSILLCRKLDRDIALLEVLELEDLAESSRSSESGGSRLQEESGLLSNPRERLAPLSTQAR